jgi:hypothetical protein
MAEIPLSEAIAGLRADLQRAISTGEGERLRFDLESVVLELEIVLSSSGSGEAKAGLWGVVTVGGSAQHGHVSTHRLTLTLTPRIAGAPPGQKTQVGDVVTGEPPLPRPSD